MLDFLYWYAELGKVNTYNEAIDYKKKVISELKKFPLELCEKRDSRNCLREGKMCCNLVSDLLDSIRVHFVSLGFHLSVLDEIDDYNGFVSDSLFDRFQNIDLFMRYREQFFNEERAGSLFERIIELNHVILAEAILVENLIPVGNRFYFYGPVKEEIIGVLERYNITVESEENPFDLDTEFLWLKDNKDDHISYESFGKILINSENKREDMKFLRDSFSGDFVGYFYLLVYKNYFIRGLESCKDYFQGKF